MSTETYALIEQDEASENLILVEVLQEEAPKQTIESALADQHGGELKDFTPLCSGAMQVIWLDDCSITLVFNVIKITGQHRYQSWAVKHDKAAA